MNKILRFIAITAMVAPTSTFASRWSCTHDDLIRTVEVEYSEDSATACKVNYTKATEGVGMQTLWSAENDVSYCEEKAEELITKLSSWGWACTESETETDPDAAWKTQPVQPHL